MTSQCRAPGPVVGYSPKARKTDHLIREQCSLVLALCFGHAILKDYKYQCSVENESFLLLRAPFGACYGTGCSSPNRISSVRRQEQWKSVGRMRLQDWHIQQDVCAFKIGISSIRFVNFSRRVTGVDFMFDRACWTLTVAAVLQDKYDDRIYFADPDKLDTITIDVSSKRTGSPAYIRKFNNLQYNQGN